MLGCHDFCGYYEWTFHYLRRNFGDAALEKYWAQAIAADAQQHYIRAGSADGLRGLYESWFKTGVDEQCEWTVTLQEDKNLLRLDMRECPSKGFLLSNDLNADQDYCDHCIGWIGPALNQVGAEVVAHEHNHCGQCWWEMRMQNKDRPPVDVEADIRIDQRWRNGYLDRFEFQTKLPIVESGATADFSSVIAGWFREFDRVVVLGLDSTDIRDLKLADKKIAVLVCGHDYVAGKRPELTPQAVILEHDLSSLPQAAARYQATSEAYRPLLLHDYLPQGPMIRFVEYSLPRPVPILPFLIRAGFYTHRPGQERPSANVLAHSLAAALNQEIVQGSHHGP